MHALCLSLALLTVSVPSAMPGLAGGFTPQEASDARFKELAWKSVPGLNRENNGEYQLVPIKVLSAKTQVVAGSNTKLEVLVGQSTCKTADAKNTQLTEANCAYKEGGERAVYEVSVWEKPWENFEQFTVKKLRDVAAGENL